VPFAEVSGGAKLTLVTVSAGWCTNCIHETRTMEEDFHERFCPSGLRILQILTEDPAGNPADLNFCAGWRRQYGLTFPVIDLTANPAVLDIAELPLHLLVDGSGTIRLRSTGRAPTNLDAEIERLLRD
jgi:hypothetical protein